MSVKNEVGNLLHPDVPVANDENQNEPVVSGKNSNANSSGLTDSSRERKAFLAHVLREELEWELQEQAEEGPSDSATDHTPAGTAPPRADSLLPREKELRLFVEQLESLAVYRLWLHMGYKYGLQMGALPNIPCREIFVPSPISPYLNSLRRGTLIGNAFDAASDNASSSEENGPT